ncbi:MAG: YihY family inner membrane protein, partial [Rhodospirillales bacterium]
MSDRDEEAVKTGFFATIPWANFVRISRHFIGFLWHRFVENDCLRLAASLSYTSMLAIVPLTAIAFSMLAAFPVFEGVREEFQSVLFKNFLPTSAEAMRDYFDQFVDNTAKLTAVGIIGLALIAVLLLGTIESALNSIFRVIRPRALLPRLLVFWALLTLGPLLLGASFSLSTYFF